MGRQGVLRWPHGISVGFSRASNRHMKGSAYRSANPEALRVSEIRNLAVSLAATSSVRVEWDHFRSSPPSYRGAILDQR
jgi:hypothetical protein